MSNRVYVGNLSWSTSWQDLKDHMRDAGEVQYAKVLQDRDGRSKGCGIVEFTEVEGAADAIEKLTDSELKGRKIFVREDREDGKRGGDRPSGEGGEGGEESGDRGDRGGNRGGDREHRGGDRGGNRGGNRGGDRDNRGGDRDNRGGDRDNRGGDRDNRGGDRENFEEGSQLFIGNLSWETGWQDLKDHFRTIGEVSRSDVAVGRDGRKKGFGFIRFETAADAAKAIEELNGVEFMGRPLEVRLDNKA
eukprot:CAMPEP_0172304624 /NCGR_PEP_ID=MMETSP1058-20130122/6009_1 /TAXON_ID=83371 /ORGANISM="Detonula confervacea, Strain CCMP 353" /LENGTH=246 /DNA_ID=CAMNT_0013015935 /DNA_START=91 /DNA_END=831 /DNA_ORIENTATION=-